MQKSIEKYAKIYRSALLENNYSDVEARVKSYEQRLQEMYASEVLSDKPAYGN